MADFYDAYPGLTGAKPAPVVTPPFRGPEMQAGPVPPTGGQEMSVPMNLMMIAPFMAQLLDRKRKRGRLSEMHARMNGGNDAG